MALLIKDGLVNAETAVRVYEISFPLQDCF